MAEINDLLRRIPKVDRLLEAEELTRLLASHPRPRVLAAVRSVLGESRRRALEGELVPEELAIPAVAARVSEALARLERPHYRRVINATGVILHTGLGRAALAPEVAAAVAEGARQSQRLEIELDSGLRGGRDRGCAELLCQLTGCEAATVVNNNAAATLLILAALGKGRKVLLSRGEMVEIGGSYRIPDILRESGCRLVEVGTTNRTRARDYREALDEETGMILKVHTSNYRIVGFTEGVELDTLVEIGRHHGVPVVHDLGSGCLADLEAHGRPGEVRVQESVAAGADLVCFSGDKLLGGPQAGLILGTEEAVDACRRHPLFRPMRPGRMIYTALEATLRIYLEGEEVPLLKVPALRQLLADEADLEQRARELAGRLEGIAGLEVSVVACTSQAGSGSLPARDYPSRGVRLVDRKLPAGELAATLRRGEPAIVPRIQDEAVLLDMRTVEDEELPDLARRLRDVVG